MATPFDTQDIFGSPTQPKANFTGGSPTGGSVNPLPSGYTKKGGHYYNAAGLAVPTGLMEDKLAHPYELGLYNQPAPTPGFFMGGVTGTNLANNPLGNLWQSLNPSAGHPDAMDYAQTGGGLMLPQNLRDQLGYGAPPSTPLTYDTNYKPPTTPAAPGSPPAQFNPAASYQQQQAPPPLPGLNTGGSNPYLTDPLMSSYRGMQNPLYANQGQQDNFYGDSELFTAPSVQG